METTKWTIDTAHSEIHFKVKHLMISNVTGKFEKFEGTVETDGDNFLTAKINLTAESASVNTGSAQRDGHIKSADFFDTENFPQLKFASTLVEAGDDDNFKLHGNLTIKNVSKPVTLDVEFAGMQKDPWGNSKAGFTVSGKINRKDWQLTYNAVLEGGGVLVSDEVRINCEVQLLKVVVPATVAA